MFGLTRTLLRDRKCPAGVLTVDWLNISIRPAWGEIVHFESRTNRGLDNWLPNLPPYYCHEAAASGCSSSLLCKLWYLNGMMTSVRSSRALSSVSKSLDHFTTEEVTTTQIIRQIRSNYNVALAILLNQIISWNTWPAIRIGKPLWEINYGSREEESIHVKADHSIGN